MSQFVKGLLVGTAIVILGGLFVVVTLALMVARSDAPEIRPDSAVVVSLRGDIPEYIDQELPSFLTFDEAGEPALFDQIRAIRRAAEDERIKALVLQCGGSGAGWAKAQELRWAIQAFKESGKPVWAFMEVAGREDYYIAALADRIVIQPKSYLSLSGLRLEVMFFKRALDKLGVEADVIRTGRYKSAGEPYSREEISPEWRQVLDEMLDEFYGQLLEGIAEGRGQDAEHWQAVLDQGPFSADETREHGLSDAVLYKDNFYEELSEAVEVEEIRRVGMSQYAADSADGGPRGGPKIAMVHASGTIHSGYSNPVPFGGPSGTLASGDFISQIDSLREDESIDGVVLRIDSPGGDAIASEQMLHAVRRLGEQKPVVVSMANVAASGGYYIAAVPDVPILAYPGTYTGSIGVFTIRLNLRALYDKLGITKEVLTRGQFAAIESDYGPMTSAERAKLRRYVDSIYDTFVNRVAEGRGDDAESIAELAEGRVWIGAQAAQNGLVDSLGGYLDAVDRVKEIAEIDPDQTVEIVTYPERRSMLESLMSGDLSAAAARLLVPRGFGAASRAVDEMESIAKRLSSGAMYMAPFEIAVQ